MVRATPNRVLTASVKVLAESTFLLIGRTTTVISLFFCALISPPLRYRAGDTPQASVVVDSTEEKTILSCDQGCANYQGT
jgi:hypothetical protein